MADREQNALSALSRLWNQVVVVRDFPSPGVSFKDLSGILADPRTLHIVVNSWADAVRSEHPTMIVGVEARGFPLGAALAYELGCGFTSLRKSGKLPRAVHSREYALEYGTGTLEIHSDALTPADRVVIVDDVLATGGTAEAAIGLVRATETHVISFAAIMDLPSLGGINRIRKLGVLPQVLINDRGEPYAIS